MKLNYRQFNLNFSYFQCISDCIEKSEIILKANENSFKSEHIEKRTLKFSQKKNTLKTNKLYGSPEKFWNKTFEIYCHGSEKQETISAVAS